METQPNSTRMLGITLMVIQLGIIFAYGFEGGFYQEQSSAPILTDLFSLLMMVVLVLLGFGLLISPYLHATWLGITTSLITLSIAVLLNPLLNKFWFNAFVSGFEDTDSLPTTSPIY
jgi:predicted exporter